MKNKKWESYKPDPEREGRVVKALEDCGVKDSISIGLVLYLFKDLGLYCEPNPENKTTAREIRKRARAAATELERQDILSERYQTVRAGRVIQVGDHERRRPEVEISYCIGMMDYHFKKALNMKTNKRLMCIAKVFIDAEICDFARIGIEPALERVRKRLNRSGEVDNTEYLLKLWYSQIEANPDKMPPFPLKSAPMPKNVKNQGV